MCRIVDSMFPRTFEASITRLALLPLSGKLIAEAAYAASEPAPGQPGLPAQNPGRTIQLPILESTYAHLYCRSRMKIPGSRPV